MADRSTGLEGAVSFRQIDQLYATIRTAIWAICIVTVAYFGFGALETFAGRSTEIDVALSLVLTALAELKFVAAISIALGGCGWAFIERMLRHRKVEYLQGRIKALETAIDPSRTSSKLTVQGKTNPSDRR